MWTAEYKQRKNRRQEQRIKRFGQTTGTKTRGDEQARWDLIHMFICVSVLVSGDFCALIRESFSRAGFTQQMFEATTLCTVHWALEKLGDGPVKLHWRARCDPDGRR